ncbi:hypothetical protein O9992_29325 [Vibrio lentus]|nr:hypothetical protein [Vibrio lentus]
MTFSCHIWNQNTLDNLAKDNIQLGINYDVPIRAARPYCINIWPKTTLVVYNKSHPIHLKKMVELEYLQKRRSAIAQLAEWNEKKGDDGKYVSAKRIEL